MKQLLYTIMAAAAMLASCTKENPQEIKPEINGIETSGHIATIGVSTQDATKAVVSADDNSQVFWETGDRIHTFCFCNDGTISATNFVVKYTLKDGAGTTSGTFDMMSDPEITSVDLIYSIVYPETAFVTISGMWGRRDHLTCTIPTVQKARKGSFDKAAAVMYNLPATPYQKDNIDEVQLKYAVNFLKITVPGSESINKIRIGSSVALTGDVVITSDGIAATEDNTENYVVLESEDGNALEPGDYYIAVRPCSIENPSIAFIFEDTQSGVATIKSKKGSGAITFADGKNVKVISFDSAKVKAHQGIRLWENGPYWATCNMGARKAEEYGHYFQWGSLWGYKYSGVKNLEWEQGDINYPGIKPLVFVEPLYNLRTYGFTDIFYKGWNNGASLSSDIDPDHDVANVMWGGGWRIPSGSEFGNLIDGGKTTISITTLNDVNGMLVTGKGAYSNNSVFFPAAGRGIGTRLEANDSFVNYWSRSYLNDEKASILYCAGIYAITVNSIYRYYGLPIRPILEF